MKPIAPFLIKLNTETQITLFSYFITSLVNSYLSHIKQKVHKDRYHQKCWGIRIQEDIIYLQDWIQSYNIADNVRKRVITLTVFKRATAIINLLQATNKKEKKKEKRPKRNQVAPLPSKDILNTSLNLEKIFDDDDQSMKNLRFPLVPDENDWVS